MSDAGDIFHPLLRHHLVNTLGWRELRPLQHKAADPILSGSHVLILAPTAGGKTEAAVLPVISRLLTEGWEGTSILYLCPLKALLNNLHNRLETYFGMVGHAIGLWHGDTSATERKRIEAHRPACLMTTPESLEVMLVSSNRDRKDLLRSVRVVVVDEIHAFAGDDRGTHLLAVIERITRLAGREIQRIGLSATVGNPEELLEWLAGHQPGRKEAITVESVGTAAEVTLDYVGSLENAVTVIAGLHRGEKRLVFCDSRRRVEELAVDLKQHGVAAYVSHSSLSLEQRREAERAFEEGEDCVILATSTLELGIDVGDLDRVIQIDAPATIASFLQRIGRTGRRASSTRNCLFLATSPDALLHAAAIIDLWESGYVEPIRAPDEPYHIFAQQILALTLQHGGLSIDKLEQALKEVPTFERLPLEDKETVLRHMIDSGLVHYDGALVAIGDEAEKRFGFRHFLELVSVFTSPPVFEVFFGAASIGTLDWLALAQNKQTEAHPVILAGKSWDIQTVDWKARRIYVVPSEVKGKVRWEGARRGLTFEIARKVHALLLSHHVSDRWSKRAQAAICERRDAMRLFAERLNSVWLDASVDRIRWATFAGESLNSVCRLMLEEKTGCQLTHSDFEITFPSGPDINSIGAIIREMLSSKKIKESVTLSDGWLKALKFSEILPRSCAQKAALGRVDFRPLLRMRPPLLTK